MSWRFALVAIAACSHGHRVQSCDDSLAGAWVSPAGERWMVLDNGATLEAYPMFDDAGGSGDIVIAPRVIDLQRDSGHLGGKLVRRTMRRAEACEARAAVRVAACRDDVIELEVGALAAPLEFAPCRWPAPAPPQIERWHRD